MNLTNIIKLVRDDYLSFYQKKIRERVDEKTEFCVELPLLLGEDFGSIREYRLYRIDLVVGSSENSDLIEINLEEFLDFETLFFEDEDNFTIEVNPFQWNHCGFWFERIPENWSLVIDWFSEWFDEEENKSSPDEFGLSGVVHSITDPESFRNGYFFSVDFGSASTKAVNELLEIFRQLGVKNLCIGSFDPEVR